ncbi:MAG: TolB family protein [Prochlorococcus sp.]
MGRSPGRSLAAQLISAAVALGLTGCGQGSVKPIHGLNRALRQSASSQRAPQLGQDWLVTLASQRGREKIELLNLRNGRRPVPLPGLNRADAQPISVSVSADGERLALIRQRENQTELLLYRRSTGLVQRLEINPRGVPRHVSISGNGRTLAVQVSRDGRWDVDLIRLPG